MPRTLRFALVAILCALTSACALFRDGAGGNAVYTYERTGLHRCKWTTDSGRSLPEGFRAEMKGCAFKVEVPKADQGRALVSLPDLMNVLSVLQSFRMPALVPPATPAAQPQGNTQ